MELIAGTMLGIGRGEMAGGLNWLSEGFLGAAEWRRGMLEMIFGRPLGFAESLVASLVVIGGGVVTLVLMIAMFSIWWERKVSAHMQSRVGPNRVGPIGLLQSLADGIKLISKEDLLPAGADRLLFRIAPYLAFAPVFAAFLALPFGPNLTFEPRLASGVFWILAILSVEVIGVILAGWASNNKWSVYGGMRVACQMVSYEIPLGLSIVVAVMSVGTMNLVELGMLQGGGIHTWVIFHSPFVMGAFVVYFIASLASNKRAPFDLPESESELVAGYHTEYSGMRFAFFFFAEYAGMFVVGGIQAAIFLGGWNDPFGLIGKYYAQWINSPQEHVAGLMVLNVIGAAMFIGKAMGIVFVQMWLRWTLPRPRIDQVLYACVKVLLPLACLLLLGGALWELFLPGWETQAQGRGIPWIDFDPWSWSEWTRGGAGATIILRSILAAVGLVGMGMVAMWVLYAIGTGRKIKTRLSEAQEIVAV